LRSSFVVGRVIKLFNDTFCFVVAVEQLEFAIGPFELEFGKDKRFEFDEIDTI
jgi:hypothetical protein